MLTEIEWWGGLLFIWGALAFWTLLHFSGENRWFNALSASTFALTGLVFALYFYELQQPLLRYVFLAAAALAGASLLVFMWFFIRGTGDDEEADSTKTASEDDEEDPWWVTALGSVWLLTPLLLPFALVGWKSWAVLQLA